MNIFKIIIKCIIILLYNILKLIYISFCFAICILHMLYFKNRLLLGLGCYGFIYSDG